MFVKEFVKGGKLMKEKMNIYEGVKVGCKGA